MGFLDWREIEDNELKGAGNIVALGIVMREYKLDLHGLRYEDARRSTIRFIEDHWSEDAQLEIVTGNSYFMRELVTEILDEYKLTYQIGSRFDHNKGYIVTWTESLLE